MNLGNRGWRAIARAPLQRGHYRALGGMVRRYPDLIDSTWRYVSGRGEYPHRCRVRTPTGTVAPTLHSSHDMSTVNEVFCREDYRAGTGLRVAVDVGANIGIASLYFLSRNPATRVYCYEPDPKNTARLRANLSAYAGRFEVEEVAVGLADGEAAFRVEPTGRYGALAEWYEPAGATDTITVRVRALNAILDDVLAREPAIDLLKIDVEAREGELVAAIRPDQLERIGTIVYETDGPEPHHLDRYSHRFANQTNRLDRLAPVAR